MTVLYAPADGKLLSCTEATFQKRRFLIPFGTFFENGTSVLHLCILPAGKLLHAPVTGIVTHVDPTCPCFFIEGHQRTALWLHTRDGAPLSLAKEAFLPLVAPGAPVGRIGQLLGRLDTSLLHKNGILLSLLTAPSGGRLRYRTHTLIGGQTPLLTAERPNF